jgi:hypothetical protein
VNAWGVCVLDWWGDTSAPMYRPLTRVLRYNNRRARKPRHKVIPLSFPPRYSAQLLLKRFHAGVPREIRDWGV